MSAVSLAEPTNRESSIVLGLEILCKVWRGSLHDLWLPPSVFRRMKRILCVPVHNQHGGLSILEAVQKPFSGSFYFIFFSGFFRTLTAQEPRNIFCKIFPDFNYHCVIFHNLGLIARANPVCSLINFILTIPIYMKHARSDILLNFMFSFGK